MLWGVYFSIMSIKISKFCINVLKILVDINMGYLGILIVLLVGRY